MADGGGHFERFRAIACAGARELSGLEFKVLAIYEQHADNETGESRPGLDRVMRWAGNCNPKRVRQARKALVGLGWLELVRPGGGQGKVNIYRVTIPERALAIMGEENTGAKTTPVSDGDTGAKLSLTGAKSVPNTGAKMTPRTTQEQTTRTTPVTAAFVSQSQGADDRLAFLATKGIESTKAIRQALADYGWTLDELQALWRKATNSAPAGERQGWTARHIANGAKPQPAPTAPTAAPWIPPGAPKSTSRANKVKAAAVLGTLTKASSDTAALAAYRKATGEQEGEQ